VDYGPVLEEIKRYAADQDLMVTWSDVEEDRPGAVEDLSKYHKRRVRTAFANWITRKRKDSKYL
jgi:hypothetical protein